MEEYRKLVVELPNGKEYVMESGSSGAAPSEVITPTEDSSNHDGEINTIQEVVNALKGFPEDKTIAEVLSEQECDLTDEDINDFFYGEDDEEEEEEN